MNETKHWLIAVKDPYANDLMDIIFIWAYVSNASIHEPHVLTGWDDSVVKKMVVF